MSEFVRKYDYQEITVEELSQVYKIKKEYNLFHDLPRQGRGDPEDKKTIDRHFTVDKVTLRGR